MTRTVTLYRRRPRDDDNYEFTRDDFKKAMNFEQEIPTCRTCVKAKLINPNTDEAVNMLIENPPIGHCMIGGFYIYERSSCDVWRDQTGGFIIDGVNSKDLITIMKHDKTGK